jgi:2-polyprenyl-3-methyl-5-hydroxy-6-metoxy-1,4-benzoquinol methylase
MTLEKCELCDNEEFKPLLQTTDYSTTHEPFAIIQCRNCGFLQTSPIPDEQDIEKYYQTTNYISHRDKPTGLIEIVYLQARKFTLRWKLSILQRLTTKKHILDYGCGTGEFLKYCLSHGYTGFGYEPTASAALLATTKTERVIASNHKQLTDSFGIITLWHVLEHVHQLNETIGFLKSRLDKDGTMFIAVPNHNSADASHYKQYWAAYDVPRHLWHFDQKTMKKLVEKHSLQIEQTIPMKLDPYYISLISEQYKTNQKFTLSSIIKAIKNAWTSNSQARKTGEYSSLIYVITHA